MLKMSGPPSAANRITFPYQQDAIRINAQLASIEDGQPVRRFSVDPCLTDFAILRNLVGRAFDLKCDFAISYRVMDDYGSETYLPMVSDWDLSAAFLSASDPDLQLLVDKKDMPMDSSMDPWDMIKSTDVVEPCALPIANHHRITSNQHQNGTKVVQIPLNFNPKINTTSLFNTMERLVHKARTFVEDISVVTSRPPLSDSEFRNYLDLAGILEKPTELRYACYYGGIEPSLRRVVWKHLLNVYPDGLTGTGRIEYIKNKSKEYYELRDAWKNAIQNAVVSEDILCVSNMVRKDVLRTDRHLKFFAGHDENPNTASLFNILTTYSINHPSVSYCQGMSDLASPLLVCMGDEAQAYICFCALMTRLNPNFSSDGIAMSLKFSHLSDSLAYYDSFFWSYLKSIGADDLLFCYRWLLLELKREFAFEDSMKMMEVLWASLPYKPQDIPLYEIKYTGATVHSIPIPVPSLTSSYSKVCAIRRNSTCQTSELRNRRLSRKQKAAPNLSLDENSVSSLSSRNTNTEDRQRKAFYSLDESTEILSTTEFTSSSPFDIISLSNLSSPTKPRLVKNLKEFYQIGSNKFVQQSDESIPTLTPQSVKTSIIDQDSLCHSLSGIGIGDDDINSVFLEECQENERENFKISDSHAESHTFNNNTEENSCASISTISNASTLVNSINKSRDLTNEYSKSSQQLTKSIADKLAKNIPEIPDNRATESEIIDSENDSGHCCSGGSLDNSLEDPEFHTGSNNPDPNNIHSIKIPSPDEFAGGNPFLMFLCLTLLLQHRDHIIRNKMDYNETAMYFDKLVRKHNVQRVLLNARQMYDNYLKQVLSHKV